MEYEQLDHEEFDAIVTGELTHWALWLEDTIDGIICEYFIGTSDREDDFRRLILYRDGLTFQDKLEIVRGLLPVFGETAERCNLKSPFEPNRRIQILAQRPSPRVGPKQSGGTT